MRILLPLTALALALCGAWNPACADAASDADDAVRTNKLERWNAWRRDLKIDYSDSSKDLEPPLTGRIAKPLALTIGGRPNAEVVCSANGDPHGVIRFAAQELTNWLEKISGAVLPVLDAPGGAPVKIFLNSPAAAKTYAKDVKFLAASSGDDEGVDGFFVRTEGSDIYIGGAVPKGVLNGVYRFLENNTTIIWARPQNDYGTVYDRNPDVKAVWADAVEKPKSRYRAWVANVDALYMTRNLVNAGHLTPEQGNLFSILAGSVLTGTGFETPEFCCLVGGKRIYMEYYQSQACLMHPGAFEYVLSNMCAKIEAARAQGADPKGIAWHVADNYQVCTCEDCTAPIRLPDGTVLTSNKQSSRGGMAESERVYRSTQYYMMANRLVRALNEKYPGMYLETLAYFFAETAPKVPLDEHILTQFAPLYSHGDFRNPIYAPSNEQVYRNLLSLEARGGKRALYEYYYFYPVAESFREDLLEYRRHGVIIPGSEWVMDMPGLDTATWRANGGRLGWDSHGADIWVMSRLMWDTGADAWRLRKYYFRRVFHEAAPEVEKFYGRVVADSYSGEGRRHEYDEWTIVREGLFLEGRGAAMKRELHAAMAKIRNPLARINYGRFLSRYDMEYEIYRRNGHPAADPFRNTMLYRAWDMNWRGPRGGVGHTTSVETREGHIEDVVMFQFPGAHFARGDKHPMTVEIDIPALRLPAGGVLAGRIRTLVPAADGKTVPLFGVGNGREPAFADAAACYRTLPDGETAFRIPVRSLAPALAGEVTRYYVSLPAAAVPATGTATFMFYDLRLLSDGVEPAAAPVAPGFWTDEGNYSTAWYTRRAPGRKAFTLRTAADLAGLAAIVNGTAAGVAWTNFAGCTVTLGAPVDLSAHRWTPIGGLLPYRRANGILKTDTLFFAGTFDGAGKKISGFNLAYDATTDDADTYPVPRATEGYCGLFGVVVGPVRNVKLEQARLVIDCPLPGNLRVKAGLLAGAAFWGPDGLRPSFSNCQVTGTMTTRARISWGSYTGGLCGFAVGPDGTGCAAFVNCSFDGAITNFTGTVAGVCPTPVRQLEKCRVTGQIENHGLKPGYGLVERLPKDATNNLLTVRSSGLDPGK